MKRWKRFWILRKQNDIVKIMVLFFGAGIFFLVKALSHGAVLYRTTQNSVEYGFSVDSQSGGLTSLAEVRQLDWVVAASTFRESKVLLGENGKELEFSCMEFSEEYLEAAYGIFGNGAMKTFYVNQNAFAKLKRALGTEEGVQELRIRFRQSDSGTKDTDPRDNTGTSKDLESGESFGTAKVLPIQETVSEEEPFVCCMGDPLRLKAEGTGIWIFGWPGLDGENVTKLTDAGITPYDPQKVQRALQEQALLWMELKYNAWIAAICLSVPFFLHSAMKMKYDMSMPKNK